MQLNWVLHHKARTIQDDSVMKNQLGLYDNLHELVHHKVRTIQDKPLMDQLPLDNPVITLIKHVTTIVYALRR